ncbi:hypothetical protein BsWGS_16707 [Bradybaena similaris]
MADAGIAGVIEDDTSWLSELETALVEECDFGSLRNICKGRPVPEHLRAEVWQVTLQICLGTVGKDALSSFDGLYDMEGQSQVRNDCKALVDKLGNDEEDKVSIVSDLETVITFYCKSRGLKYSKENGWMDILQVLLAVKMTPSELYNCFYAIQNKYIPNSFKKTGQLFHLFRLLLQYHDPELCSYLDTRRVTPDLYAMSWFNSLFGGTCDLHVCLSMWDVIFQHADPFLQLFMGLVILVNARDSILESKDQSRGELVDSLSTFPQALEAEDVEDFCSLAQYYASKTPQSFRRDYQLAMFGGSVIAQKEFDDHGVMDALCLMVSGEELLQANRNNMISEDSVRYFVVDCRPAEQYNSEHLTTAFHLDSSLMLQNPEEFSVAVQALFTAQIQALAAGSAASGEHLCFLGSGREEEDQYINMVVANILQRGKQYVSIAKGGYPAIHNILKATSENGIDEMTQVVCDRGGDITSNNSSGSRGGTRSNDAGSMKYFSRDLLGKLSDVVKTKSAEMKVKLSNYIKNEGGIEKHVSSAEKGGKRYRNMANVFTIGDEEEGEEHSGADSEDDDDQQKEVVSLETWIQKPDVVYSCKCTEIRTNGHTFNSYLLVTSSHLYILREIPSRKGMAHIQARRALGSIVKITSKKRQPELITFKYGTHEEDGFHVTDIHRFYIPTASDATRVIKQQIMKVLDALDS